MTLAIVTPDLPIPTTAELIRNHKAAALEFSAFLKNCPESDPRFRRGETYYGNKENDAYQALFEMVPESPAECIEMVKYLMEIDEGSEQRMANNIGGPDDTSRAYTVIEWLRNIVEEVLAEPPAGVAA